MTTSLGKHQARRDGDLDAIEAVVVGTSSGGIEALSTLLPGLPAAFKPCVLIVVHLPRERPSLLVEIFKSRCHLPVKEATDKEVPEQGTVYFAPPDYHLLVDEGPLLALSDDDLVHFSRPAIDVLFESAADCYGAHVLGVVLTGANEDGAAGLDAIRRAGGISVVQTPATAASPRMPEAALAKGPADYVLPLEGIAKLMLRVGGATA